MKALTDPTPIFSESEAAANREAFLRVAMVDRKHRNHLRTYREARLDFVTDPCGAIRRLKDQGRSWGWVTRVLAITQNEAWTYYRGETP